MRATWVDSWWFLYNWCLNWHFSTSSCYLQLTCVLVCTWCNTLRSMSVNSCGIWNNKTTKISTFLWTKTKTTQHRKVLWHNGGPSHNLRRRLTLTHDLDKLTTNLVKERKNKKPKNSFKQSSQWRKKRDMRGPNLYKGRCAPGTPVAKTFREISISLEMMHPFIIICQLSNEQCSLKHRDVHWTIYVDNPLHIWIRRT